MDYTSENLPVFTFENLAALNAAIATGAKRVEYQDKTVEYRSLAEMFKIRALILGQLGAATGRGRRRMYASVSKGTTT